MTYFNNFSKEMNPLRLKGVSFGKTVFLHSDRIEEFGLCVVYVLKDRATRLVGAW